MLKQRWNDKLEALEKLQARLDAHSDATASLSPAKKEAILVLGNDFVAVRGDPAWPLCASIMRLTHSMKRHATRDTNTVTLGQATKHCGVCDTTTLRLIQENILTAEQLEPYAPLEINRADLDSEPAMSECPICCHSTPAKQFLPAR